MRLHAADTIGAWIAACGTAEGRALLAFRKDADALADRVAINVALARLSEIDDIHLGAMITPGAIVVPAALTIAASLPDVAADDIAAAIVAGYEAMIRLGAAIDGPSVLYRGIWPTYFAAPFGAAAVAARLLQARREADRECAVGRADHGGAGHRPSRGADHGALARGRTCRRPRPAGGAGGGGGIHLRREDRRRRLPEEHLRHRRRTPRCSAAVWAGWRLSQTSFKPWCAARQTMAATQALKEMLADGIDAESILRIGVAVLPPHLKMIDHGVTAGDRFSHLTSVQYQMAVAALAPDLAYGLSGPAGAVSPALAAFMARIQVRAEESCCCGLSASMAGPCHRDGVGRRERT